MNTGYAPRGRASLLAVVLAAPLIWLTGQAQAQDITATGTQPGGANWNQATWTGGQWSDGLVPSSGKTYSTANFVIRTLEPGSSTFGGASLRLAAGGLLSLKQAYANTATVSLILDGGTLFSGVGTTGGDQQYVAGGVNVAANSFVALNDINSRRITLRNGAMSGSGNVTIQGGNDVNDLLMLEGTMTSTHTGNWIVNGGRLIVNLDSHIHDLAGVTMGGTTATAFLDIRSAQRIGSLSGAGTVRTGVAGSWTLTVGGNGADTTFAGLIENGSGTLLLAKEGAGTLTLTGANTFTGAVGAQYGVLRLEHGNALGSAAKTVSCNTAASDGTIHLAGGISIPAAVAFSVSGLGDGTAAPLVNVSGNNTVSGNLNLTGGRGNAELVSRSGTFTLNGAIAPNATLQGLVLSGAGNGLIGGAIANGTTVDMPVTKNDAGTWTLSGPNTYSGLTTVNAGTLRATRAAALPGYGTAGQVTVAGPATLLLSYGGAGEWTSGELDSLQANNGAGFAAGATLALNTANGSASHGSDIAAANLRLAKLGANTLTLSGANTYGGGTVVTEGALWATRAAALPGYGTAGQVTVASGATLVVSYGGAGEWAGGDLDALLANNGAGFAAGAALALDTANGSASYGSIAAASLGLTKSGANTLTLTGANTYGGGTRVSAGTLALGAGSSLAATPSITVADGAVLDTTASGGLTLGATQTLTAGRTSGAAADINGNLACDGTLNVAGTAVGGTLTVNGDLNLTGSSLVFDLGTAADRIVVQGQLNVGVELLGFSDFTFGPLPGFSPTSTYVLIDAATLAPGCSLDPADRHGTIDGLRYSLTLDPATAQLVLVSEDVGQGSLFRMR